MTRETMTVPHRYSPLSVTLRTGDREADCTCVYLVLGRGFLSSNVDTGSVPYYQRSNWMECEARTGIRLQLTTSNAQLASAFQTGSRCDRIQG